MWTRTGRKAEEKPREKLCNCSKLIAPFTAIAVAVTS
jgi:hypothetical protein